MSGVGWPSHGHPTPDARYVTCRAGRDPSHPECVIRGSGDQRGSLHVVLTSR